MIFRVVAEIIKRLCVNSSWKGCGSFLAAIKRKNFLEGLMSGVNDPKMCWMKIARCMKGG